MTKIDYISPTRISTDRQCQALNFTEGTRCRHKARWRVSYSGNEFLYFKSHGEPAVLWVSVELCDLHKKATEP